MSKVYIVIVFSAGTHHIVDDNVLSLNEARMIIRTYSKRSTLLIDEEIIVDAFNAMPKHRIVVSHIIGMPGLKTEFIVMRREKYNRKQVKRYLHSLE